MISQKTHFYYIINMIWSRYEHLNQMYQKFTHTQPSTQQTLYVFLSSISDLMSPLDYIRGEFVTTQTAITYMKTTSPHRPQFRY